MGHQIGHPQPPRNEEQTAVGDDAKSRVAKHRRKTRVCIGLLETVVIPAGSLHQPDQRRAEERIEAIRDSDNRPSSRCEHAEDLP